MKSVSTNSEAKIVEQSLFSKFEGLVLVLVCSSVIKFQQRLHDSKYQASEQDKTAININLSNVSHMG